MCVRFQLSYIQNSVCVFVFGLFCFVVGEVINEHVADLRTKSLYLYTPPPQFNSSLTESKTSKLF